MRMSFKKVNFDASVRDYLTKRGKSIIYLNKSKEDLKVELIRDASLASMSLVLLANEAGLETITMSGYDSEQLKSALKISDRYLDVMLIAMGKGIKEGHKTVRHDVNKVIYKNKI